MKKLHGPPVTITVVGRGWLGLFATGNAVLAAIACMEAEKMLTKPSRIARSARECRLCGNPVNPGDKVRDGGRGHVSHVPCVEMGVYLFKRMKAAMKRRATHQRRKTDAAR